MEQPDSLDFDVDLTATRVQEISDPDALAAFFASLGYNIEGRIEQTPGNLGIEAESVKRPIKRIELIADQEGLFQVYLFELTSVSVAQTRALARAFRNRAGNYLIVLTSDWDRIDFVLVDKFVPKASPKAVSPPMVGIRPRTLTVNRRNPSTVHLRVLRRFTNTEFDPFYQFEKIRSAYAIADWSEDFFNNRALFSDYFLTSHERFRSWAEWKEDAKPAFKTLFDIYRDAAAKFGGKKESEIRNGLLEPTLKALGFELHPGKTASSDDHDADYFLRSHKAPGENIAACLVYPWDRSLDGKDDNRDTDTPEENPGAVVVSILEKNLAPWAIITNGRVWRLYSQRTHSRATNYYEIDLEEVLSQTGPKSETIAESFRYFWLLFRVQAFEPITETHDGKEQKTSFLNRLLDESEGYAKELGERLKERVFMDVFPLLGEGIVEFIKQEEGKDADIDQDRLDAVFQGVLTLLYRLLFLLYAEARDLLPVREARGYAQKSLDHIKIQVAEKAGKIGDQVEENLKRTYRLDEYKLYNALAELCRIIDGGDSSLNVPLYNGGLFLTQPDDQDRSVEARNARFLRDNKVPDRYLALAIDLLARDLDPKRQDLVFIDFKSLGVRQLGSIYEGLLEFKLRIANQKMALVKGKKSELVIPYSEAKKDAKLKILTEGRGQNAKEKTFSKGTVYLENDKRERKSTGSYYTPDHIVEYIVANAVGPVLEEKFEKMRPKLRDAQRERKAFFDKQKALEKTGIKPEPIEKADLIGRELVDELFDLKVLDMAMGSGHFLVETVDFITDKALDFLNGFPWNPVFAHLERMRKTILKEMEDQSITIDPARLTDVNLLKRHILKKCIYGVDLNPMAVELAKVSLWLDCFTLGAPLSFLDHHLKCGNSLIGVSVDEVRKKVEGEIEKGHQQSLLFGSPFTGLLLATDLMRHVGDLSDITADQVRQSRAEYSKASDALTPFKMILNVYASQWFGNGDLKKLKKNVGVSPALMFLRGGESDGWIRDPHDLDSLSPHGREVATIALSAAEEKRVFHWELEFPEVFYGPRKGTTQVIERLPEAGFDAVVGNPPYVRQEGLGEDKPFLEFAHAPVYSGVADLYVYFYHQGLAMLRRGGRFGMITSNKFLRANYGKGLRSFLTRHTIIDLIDFRDLPVFDDAIAYPLILIAEKTQPAEDHAVLTCSVADMDEANRIGEVMESAASMSLSSLSEEGWSLQSPQVLALLKKIRAAGKPLGEVVEGKFYRGVLTGFNEAFIIDEAKRQELIKADPKSAEIIKPFLRGKDVKRWKVEWAGLYLVFTRRGININKYPAIKAHLAAYKDRLMPGVEGGRKPGPYEWYEIQDSIAYYAEFEKPKIVWGNLSTSPSFAFTVDPFYVNAPAVFMPTDDLFLVAIMNSKVSEYFFNHVAIQRGGNFLEFKPIYVEQLPIPSIERESEEILSRLVSRVLDNSIALEGVQIAEREIDEIVYRLYGLTEEEIRLVEGGLG